MAKCSLVGQMTLGNAPKVRLKLTKIQRT